MAEPAGLERGRTKVNLIRELALGARTKNSLAREFNVSHIAIAAFEKRHADEIVAVRADLENAFAGLWVAKQTDRIAELQQLIEDISEQLEREVTTGGMTSAIGIPLAKLLLSAYQQVALELGQVVKAGQGVDQVPPKVVYNFGGFDPSKL